ncbi:helix-turn-helix domain-containing protein [Robertmurraya sp.]|jgi:two-component system, response regulator YesN|uniref:response regulator transcription factor n=1 Tax=Robertmurraya sp. TaxID=2837525 RepID=UPI0037046BE6
MQCLLIDDDIPTLEVLRDFIDWELFNIFDIVFAHNIAEAKELIEANVPEIIICDIEMPKGTGIDLIKWVRENNYNSAFIFFTCHENFEFASNAISYHADAYLTKPFEKNKIEATLAKVVESYLKKNQIYEFSQYGSYWLKNKGLVEKSFWNDILFENIPSRMESIQEEMVKRNLSLALQNKYYLLLVCFSRSQMDDVLEERLIKDSICSETADIFSDDTNEYKLIHYVRDDTFCIAAILIGDPERNNLKFKCGILIKRCAHQFNLTATCYISEPLSIQGMAETKVWLDELDQKNIASKGKVIFQNENFNYYTNGKYALNEQLFNEFFLEGKKVPLVNTLKNELEKLAAENRLDSIILHSICQDFLQIVYSYLHKNKVQPHKLFSTKISQTLFRKSEKSIFDMMKWATYITNTAIDYVREVKKSESVVEKAKQYIFENYQEEISREMVAASVYLTPDYFAKIFKLETGVTITEFINNYRIQVAKELLVQNDVNITEIARETGFESISYFSTVFKKTAGETPHSYRKKMRG